MLNEMNLIKKVSIDKKEFEYYNDGIVKTLPFTKVELLDYWIEENKGHSGRANSYHFCFKIKHVSFEKVLLCNKKHAKLLLANFSGQKKKKKITGKLSLKFHGRKSVLYSNDEAVSFNLFLKNNSVENIKIRVYTSSDHFYLYYPFITIPLIIPLYFNLGQFDFVKISILSAVFVLVLGYFLAMSHILFGHYILRQYIKVILDAKVSFVSLNAMHFIILKYFLMVIGFILIISFIGGGMN